VRLILVLLSLSLGFSAAWARPARVILLRHAEEPADPANVHLSARGLERARALAGYLTSPTVLGTNGPPVALFAPMISPHGHATRPSETLQPLAKRLKLPVTTPYPARDYAALARRILQDNSLDGQTVVICWVHDYLPELAEALGVRPPPRRWKGSVFDRTWIVTWRPRGASLVSLPQDLLPGDSSW
jgi:hypothetical protein